MWGDEEEQGEGGGFTVKAPTTKPALLFHHAQAHEPVKPPHTDQQQSSGCQCGLVGAILSLDVAWLPSR